MLPWLRTILRNHFYSEQVKRRREILDVDAMYSGSLVTKAEQTGRIEYKRAWTELSKLPANLKDALILIGVDGMSYDSAARAVNCPKGTMKTRVHRAREKLAKAMGFDDVCCDFTDAIVASVIEGAERARSALRSNYK